MSILDRLRRLNARDKRRYDLLEADKKQRRQQRSNAKDKQLEEDFPSAQVTKFLPFW